MACSASRRESRSSRLHSCESCVTGPPKRRAMRARARARSSRNARRVRHGLGGTRRRVLPLGLALGLARGGRLLRLLQHRKYPEGSVGLDAISAAALAKLREAVVEGRHARLALAQQRHVAAPRPASCCPPRARGRRARGDPLRASSPRRAGARAPLQRSAPRAPRRPGSRACAGRADGARPCRSTRTARGGGRLAPAGPRLLVELHHVDVREVEALRLVDRHHLHGLLAPPPRAGPPRRRAARARCAAAAAARRTDPRPRRAPRRARGRSARGWRARKAPERTRGLAGLDEQERPQALDEDVGRIALEARAQRASASSANEQARAPSPRCARGRARRRGWRCAAARHGAPRVSASVPLGRPPGSLATSAGSFARQSGSSAASGTPTADERSNATSASAIARVEHAAHEARRIDDLAPPVVAAVALDGVRERPPRAAPRDTSSTSPKPRSRTPIASRRDAALADPARRRARACGPRGSWRRASSWRRPGRPRARDARDPVLDRCSAVACEAAAPCGRARSGWKRGCTPRLRVHHRPDHALDLVEDRRRRAVVRRAALRQRPPAASTRSTKRS